jgi:hypothetical protein
MSSTGMAWARQQRAGNPTAKATLLLLGELVGDDGTTTRSQSQLAEILEFNRDTAGRALIHLEKIGLIRRERRQASDTKRLPDKITLAIQGAFTVEPLPNDVPETEPAKSEHANIEHSNIEQREHANIEQREHANIEQSINSSVNSPLTQTPADGASAATGELAIPGLPPRAEVAIQGQQGQIADWVVAEIKGGVPRMALFKMAQAPLAHGYSAREVALAMKAVWFMDRSLNAQTLARYLQGITRPGGQPKPSTTNQRVGDALSRAARYRAEEEANAKV